MVKLHRAASERTGLIQAQHVHARQHLNRRQFLHQHLTSGQSHGRRREVNRS